MPMTCNAVQVQLSYDVYEIYIYIYIYEFSRPLWKPPILLLC